jgi:hypothetical protein
MVTVELTLEERVARLEGFLDALESAFDQMRKKVPRPFTEPMEPPKNRRGDHHE